MAKKLIDQDEAARTLGITVDALNSLRDRGKLYPKRDGGVWKYDQEDIERYQRELNEGSNLGQSWESISLDDISLEDNPDSVLLSEAELGESTTGKSTIIGRKRPDEEASDIRLAGDSDLKLKSESGTKPGMPAAGSSDLNLLASSSDAPLELAGDSKISFADDPAPSGSDTNKAGSSGLFEEEEFSLEPIGSNLGSGSGSGKSPTPHSSGSFKLDDDDLLGDSGSDSNRDKSGDTAKGAGSSLQLDDDDELVLDGGHGSDITMSGADSGIMLVDPADSGLSLDSPMTLGGGGDELTIGEDDMITLEEQVDVEGATQLRTSEDFALTPTMGGDDDSDSGSQVIALDSEDDMSGAGMFGSGSSDSLLSEDAGFGSPMDAGMGVGVGLAASPAMMQVAAYPEAPYSIWNVIGLVCCTLLLMTGGMMVYDLSMQIWSWNKPFNYNSSIMDSLLNMFEK